MAKEESDCESVTALDVIREQDMLEREARESMPYSPDECTYNKGSVRQPVFACLSCAEENNTEGIGICYSCSIQCHSTHNVVELFSKRNFVCDCGTSRMRNSFNGACKLRMSQLPNSLSNFNNAESIPEDTELNSVAWSTAEDIPSSSNVYGHNFKGLFCSCNKPYNPLEETGNMIQCIFGEECGEDWFHDKCIMGLTSETEDSKSIIATEKKSEVESSIEGETKDEADLENRGENDNDGNLLYFPNVDEFDSFICWKCVNRFRYFFDKIKDNKDIIYEVLPYISGVRTLDEWKTKKNRTLIGAKEDGPPNKRIKLEAVSSYQYSVFLKNNFKEKLIEIRNSSSVDPKVKSFLTTYNFLCEDDPIFEPPEEGTSTNGSLYDLGTEALHNMPRDKALDGLAAYEKVSTKLREFLKPFAQENRIVTPEEIKKFFGNINGR